jgi:hypothetical protein
MLHPLGVDLLAWAPSCASSVWILRSYESFSVSM